MASRRALIVGAGIAHLAAAAGLHRHGWHVEVRESAAEVRALGTALGIWPDAQHALHAPSGETWGSGVLFGITALRPGTTNWYCSIRTSADQLDADALVRRVGAAGRRGGSGRVGTCRPRWRRTSGTARAGAHGS